MRGTPVDGRYSTDELITKHKWLSLEILLSQVETRRLKQKSAAIREELGREEVEEVEGLELFKDVSDEK